MKSILNYTLYVITIIFSVLAKVGMILLAALLVVGLLNGSLLSNGEISLLAILYLVGIVICFALDRGLFYLRVNSREAVEFDEKGNKKKNTYKYLSAKEKKEIDKQHLQEQERILSIAELKKMTHKGSLTPEEDLNKLIGLKNVKEDVLKMKAKMEYDKKYQKKKASSISSYHMCFLGNPGTGKTTVARIMTGLLYKYKYIKQNKYIEVDASELKGSTPDETLKRTKMILNRSDNGVLFIDEAYSLLSGVNGSELIAEIVKFMEDHKDNFILILAGYKKDMTDLINSNPGLYSRINKFLLFKDYDLNELQDIFRYTANEAGYCVDADACEKFAIKIDRERKKNNFGNARSVKNIFNQILNNHAFNIMNGLIDNQKTYIITGKDVDIEDKEEQLFA